MSDILFLALLAGFSVLSMGLVVLCDLLMGGNQ